MIRQMKDLFGIDPRALAGFRIGLGAVLLVDLVIRAVDLTAHYTDAGLLPRKLWAEYAAGTWRWSIHAWHGSVTYETLLFLIAGAAAVAVLFGLFTRWVVCLSWILLVSLQNRNPLVVNGGDVLLRMLLFWSMFLPLGCRWSLDRWIGNRRQPGPNGQGNEDPHGLGDGAPRTKMPAHNRDPQPVFSVATVAILLQLAVVYWMSGYFKYRGIWSDPEGFWQLLAVDTYAKPLLIWLLQFRAPFPWIGYSVLALEIIGPLLAFSPWRTATWRLIVVFCFWLMHIGIELTLTVGLFSYVSMLAWVLFLPRSFWDSLGRIFGIGEPAVQQAIDPATPSPHRSWIAYLANGLALVALIFVISWNLSALSRTWAKAFRNQPVRRIDDLLTLRQRWSMFSNPQRHNGWFVVVARLADGQVVDFLRDGQPADWESFGKPVAICRRYSNHRWRKFYRNLAAGSGMRCCGALCRCLADQWNRSHPPEASVESVEVHYMEPLGSDVAEQDRFVQRILHVEEFGGRRDD